MARLLESVSRYLQNNNFDFGHVQAVAELISGTKTNDTEDHEHKGKDCPYMKSEQAINETKTAISKGKGIQGSKTGLGNFSKKLRC